MAPRSGWMIHTFGPEMGHKLTHPQTGHVSLRCEGSNDKNDYDRQTPCDQDYLRKLAQTFAFDGGRPNPTVGWRDLTLNFQAQPLIGYYMWLILASVYGNETAVNNRNLAL